MHHTAAAASRYRGHLPSVMGNAVQCATQILIRIPPNPAPKPLQAGELSEDGQELVEWLNLGGHVSNQDLIQRLAEGGPACSLLGQSWHWHACHNGALHALYSVAPGDEPSMPLQ